MPRPVRSRIARLSQLTLGVSLIAAAPVTAPLPGPAATMLAMGGLVLVLRNSVWARRKFARATRRWPRFGGVADRLMRRASAARRRGRAKQPS